ncbi:MAG: T9SS type A sorting domain-containing protein [Bacteroidales bacterium]|nr:T9SS type A sorting domain-containing protein [Bacteroidales bacterium]MCF8346520.1 T9SS type A sorting domain-containing protein [Bacteroidales bacterium]
MNYRELKRITALVVFIMLFRFAPGAGELITPAEAGIYPGSPEKLASSVELKADSVVGISNSILQIVYNTGLKQTKVYADGVPVLNGLYASAIADGANLSSMDFDTFQITEEAISDEIGTGKKLTVKLSSPGLDVLIQNFYLYDDASWFLTDVYVVGNQIASNYIAPLKSDSVSRPIEGNAIRALFVPFDNDKWIRYSSFPAGYKVTSYEVTSVYDADTKQGIVIGSVEHDVWKSGIVTTTGSDGSLNSIEAYGGISTSNTRDVIPHGNINGDTLKSPKIMVGLYADWRLGMESYAGVNTTLAPSLPWDKGVPFGWNSWGSIQDNINLTNAKAVSDFVYDELQSRGFSNDGITYIGLDSYWDNLNDYQLKSFVDYCHANDQEAGIYWAPFVEWWRDDSYTVEGSSYKYRDIFLYANGNKVKLDGAWAIDPTHPGSKERIDYYIGRFKAAGFKYIKIDFLTHGAIQADAYYDASVSTGIQAYNAGMSYLLNAIGTNMFVNQAISPLFPYQYAHSRRIACDAYAAIGDTEYTLNSHTYGWWLSHLYQFSDADHLVLNGASEAENRARITSGAITGLFLAGDDFSATGNEVAKNRAVSYFTNKEINEIARIGKPFVHLNGNTGDRADNVFTLLHESSFYLAVFNYSSSTTSHQFNLEALGLETGQTYTVKELWTHQVSTIENEIEFDVPAQDVMVYRFYLDGTGPTNQDESPLKGEEINLYPNPVRNVLYASNMDLPGKYQVIDISGAILIEDQIYPENQGIPVSGLLSGMYLLRILNHSGNSDTYKFLKE